MLTRISITLILILIISNNLYSQEYSWKIVPNSPVAGTRFNDCSFINPNTGWVCNGDNGIIYRTTNGGNTWFLGGSTSQANRCISFFDSLNGWTGEFSGSNRLYKTSNGGMNWFATGIPAPSSTGLCGFSTVNDSVMYGCGRYWGPARVIKTTNKGNSWTNIDMSGYTHGLVDCYFFNEDSGIVVGRSTTGSNTRGIVLNTYDGGKNWDTSYITTHNWQWCWKISFPTENTGYISLEPSGTDSTFFLKTTDGGQTWAEKLFLPARYDEEGIGFINETTGWIGGWSPYTYETTDGGDSWHLMDPVSQSEYASNVNRFVFFGDTLGYAVGEKVYKYSKDILTNVNTSEKFAVNNFKLYQNYPNPFNPKTKIKIDMPYGADVSVTIFNILGIQVATIIEGNYLPAGVHEFDWDASGFASGVYYYKLYNKDFETSKRMMLIK